MAFGERDYGWRTLVRTIQGTFDFTGRSRRTEVGLWWFGAGILPGLIESAVTWPGSEQAGRMAGVTLALLLLIPWPALLVRRLHDHGRTGWWALLLPILIAMNLQHMLAQASTDFAVRMAHQPSGLLGWIDLLLILALFAFSFAPETIGPNRFGPDPREHGEDPAADSERLRALR